MFAEFLFKWIDYNKHATMLYFHMGGLLFGSCLLVNKKNVPNSWSYIFVCLKLEPEIICQISIYLANLLPIY